MIKSLQGQTRWSHLQGADGDNAADSAADGGQAKGRQEAGDSALDLDEEDGGTVLAQDSEQLAGVSTDRGGLGDEVRAGGDLGNDGADGALQGGEVSEVQLGQEAGESGLDVDEEAVAVQVGDAQVGDGVALQVAAGKALDGADETTDQGADLGETESGEETLNGGGELDESNLALLGGDGQVASAEAAGGQLADGGGNLSDLADGLGDGAQVKAGQLLGESRLELNQDVLGGLVGDGHNAVDLAGGGVGHLVVSSADIPRLGESRRQASRDAGGQRNARGDDAGGKAAGHGQRGRQSGSSGRQNGGDGEGLHLEFRERLCFASNKEWTV